MGNGLPAVGTRGGSGVLQESFEPGEALALLGEQRCSFYYGMANMARAMLEHPDRPRRALAAMRTGLTIGLPEDIQMTMEAVAAGGLFHLDGPNENLRQLAGPHAPHPPAPALPAARRAPARQPEP